MLISLQAMIGSFRFSANSLRLVLGAMLLSAIAFSAMAQDPRTADPVDPLVSGDPVDRADPVDTADPVEVVEAANPDPVAELVLPGFCAGSGISAQDCLDILGQMELERYCRIRGVDAADCAAFISAYELPTDCRNANVSAPTCIDFLERTLLNYRTQSKNLRANCNGDDLSVCQPIQDENAALGDRIKELEAELAEAKTENAALRDENTELVAGAEDLRAQLALAEEAVRNERVDVADVCHAAALRLNARARAALGDGAPVLDEAACARNPIAEVTRFLGAQDLPKDTQKASDVFGDSGPLPEPKPAPQPEPDPDPQPEPEPTVAPTDTATALPTEEELVAYLVTDPGVFGGLAPVRFNRLIRELSQGTSAREAVDLVWPSSSDPAELERADRAVELLCENFPVTCPD